jgi:hypothetical protein
MTIKSGNLASLATKAAGNMPTAAGRMPALHVDRVDATDYDLG